MFDHESGDRGIIVYRSSIRHRAHRRESAGHRRRCTAADCFLVLVARFAQMHVHVDETGSDDQSGRIKYFCAFGYTVAEIRQSDDAAVLEENIPAGVDALRRIDNVAVLN